MMNTARVATPRIFGWRPKVDRTVDEVLDSKRSFSTAFPVVVTRLDTPRGGMYIVDGYHRVVEAILRGDPWVLTTIDPNIPRIERTGGAHRTWVEEKVNLRTYLDRLWGLELPEGRR